MVDKQLCVEGGIRDRVRKLKESRKKALLSSSQDSKREWGR